MESNKRKLNNYAKVGLAALILNGCAFTQVGIQKLCGVDGKQAAMMHTMEANPYAFIISSRAVYVPIYGIGYTLGHGAFYKDWNYAKTGEEELKRVRDSAKQRMKMWEEGL